MILYNEANWYVHTVLLPEYYDIKYSVKLPAWPYIPSQSLTAKKHLSWRVTVMEAKGARDIGRSFLDLIQTTTNHELFQFYIYFRTI